VQTEDIIHRIQQNDEAVFAELYRMFRDEFVIWISRKQNLNEQDACDVFQNAVVIFYQNVKSGKVTRLTSSVKTYLFGIGLNKGREWRRKESRISGEEPSPVLLESMMDNYEASEKEALEEQLNLMYRALRKMGDPCKSILELYYFQKLSMEEIASLNGYSGGDSVKTQKYKCIARLRKIYREVMQKAG
jgi:RNA polymerase sigma-70 factor (ECF subfamily)